MRTGNSFIFNFNMKNHIVSFIIKLFCLCLPIILLLFLYIVTDPFKVIYHYDSYYASDNKPYVGLNKDYVSTETFFNNYSNYKYDSFIFGSSRSFFYQVKDWQEHISSKKCFHFDAANESLYGVNAKLNYLTQKKIPIKNVLLVLDNEALAVTNNSQGHLFLKHPILSGQNWLLFHMEFIKAFFNRGFLTEYIRFLLTDKIEKNIFQGGFLDDTPLVYDLASNEIRLEHYENMININPKTYYLLKKHHFNKKSAIPGFYPSIIKDRQKRILKEIYQTLTNNKTIYRIIISPLYDQIKFNTEDYNYLSELFGKQNVYDFSGINKITDDIHNYYDYSHYRPHVAKYILDVVYKK